MSNDCKCAYGARPKYKSRHMRAQIVLVCEIYSIVTSFRLPRGSFSLLLAPSRGLCRPAFYMYIRYLTHTPLNTSLHTLYTSSRYTCAYPFSLCAYLSLFAPPSNMRARAFAARCVLLRARPGTYGNCDFFRGRARGTRLSARRPVK